MVGVDVMVDVKVWVGVLVSVLVNVGTGVSVRVAVGEMVGVSVHWLAAAVTACVVCSAISCSLGPQAESNKNRNIKPMIFFINNIVNRLFWVKELAYKLVGKKRMG
jgi:hypothetical protein